MLDCGGGTTDIGVYSVGLEYPFRLGKEVTPAAGTLYLIITRTCLTKFPLGVVCGSGDLNRHFRNFAIEQLKTAKYPEINRVSLEDIINLELMPRFENEYKRSFSLKMENKEKSQKYRFLMRGLEGIKGNARVRSDAFVLSL